MLRHLIYSLLGNAAALLACGYLISGFDLKINDWQAFAALVGVLTAVNVIIKPLIRFFLGPLIILTLGLFNIVITGGILYIVDKYSENLSITGLPALIYGTLILTVVNLIVHALTRRKNY